MIELFRTMAVLAEPPGPQTGQLARAVGIEAATAAEHTALFVIQLFPYASVYLGPEGKVGGVAQDRVAGFLRALHAPRSPEPDHLSSLLGAYAAILERQREASDPGEEAFWGRARETMLVEHLVSWLPTYLQRAVDLGGPAYRGWAAVVDDLLASEVARTPVAATSLARHLLEAPEVRDPRRHPTSEFLEDLLAPVRSGILVTAEDLARAAGELGLGRRIAERRFALRSLLTQDAPGTLSWLGDVAAETAEARSGHWLAATATGSWWQRRSHRTASQLHQLAAEAHVMMVGVTP
jgi:TorA maturation chaperone TorD